MPKLVVLILCWTLLFAVSSVSARADSGDYRILSHGAEVSFDQMADSLSKADVVFIGEQHDHKLGHALELDVLKAIHLRKPKLALSLEMFERDVQLVLDEYLTGRISQASFVQASRPWPNYKTDYAPLVEFCKENRIPVIAANAPRRYVSVASRQGQKSLLDLPKESRSFLAHLPYSMDLPAEYDRQLTEVFSNHGPAGSTQAAQPAMPSQPFIKEGQGLWDATMADSILKAKRAHKGRLILQVNGAMHSDSRFGIVDRLHTIAPNMKILTISIKPDAEYLTVDSTKYGSVADYVIVTKVEATDANK